MFAVVIHVRRAQVLMSAALTVQAVRVSHFHWLPLFIGYKGSRAPGRGRNGSRLMVSLVSIRVCILDIRSRYRLPLANLGRKAMEILLLTYACSPYMMRERCDSHCDCWWLISALSHGCLYSVHCHNQAVSLQHWVIAKASDHLTDLSFLKSTSHAGP